MTIVNADEDGVNGMSDLSRRVSRDPKRWRSTGVALAAVIAVLGVGVRGVAAQDSGRRSAQDSARSREEARTLTLEDAVGMALRQSRDVQDARLGLRQAQEQVSQAWSNVYPSVDLNASYTRNVSPAVNFLPAIIFNPDAGPDDLIPVRFGADNQWNSTISLEQPLFSAAAFLGVGAAGRYENLQEEMVRGRKQAVVTQVRLSYYQLLLGQEQHRLTENSLHRVRESLKETQAMQKAGLSSDYDVLRLQVELANLEPNLRRAENAVSQARRQLAIQLDLEEDAAIRVEGSLATMNLDSVSANQQQNRQVLSLVGFRDVGEGAVDDAISTARAHRSDLRQLELEETLHKTEMRLEEVQYLPKVTLFGSYVIMAQQNGSPVFFGSNLQRAYARAVGVRVSLPIFQGFNRDARIDEKRAVLRQAETRTSLAISQAKNEVTTLVEQADEALLRARGQKLAVNQAQRGFEIASAQYREGISSQLELTDAEVALRQSEFNYAQAVYDYLVARAKLDQATGSVPLVDVGTSDARQP